MNKYIVINSEDIQKRIKELEKSDEFLVKVVLENIKF